MSLSDSRVVQNQPHDEEVILSDEDSLFEKEDTMEASAEVGTFDSPPVHYDDDREEPGYDDLMSGSDLRSHDDDDTLGAKPKPRLGRSQGGFAQQRAAGGGGCGVWLFIT